MICHMIKLSDIISLPHFVVTSLFLSIMAEKQEKRSPVWQYFEVIEDGGKKKAKCNLCHQHVSYSGGSTGTMTNHIKFVHKSLKIESNVDKLKKQPPITAFRVPVNTAMTKVKWQKCTEKIAHMCARDLRPISIVEGGGFKDFCQELNPSYDVPGRTTIAKYVSLSYDQLKAELIKTISSQPGVSLTTDHWTSLATEGYITVTGHFIDADWKFNNCVLATRKTTEKHSGVNIHTDLMNVCREFAINAENITSLVSDNASNMVSCAALLPNNITHVRCFGHTLQLSIRGSFDKTPTITRTIGSAKHLVTHFRKSVNVRNELERRQRQMGIAQNTLILDCPTRWNSTYDMFERLLEQRLAIYAVLHDQAITKPSEVRVLDLTDDQWTLLEAIVPVLKPLYMSTRLMCSEEYPTLSGIYPVLFSLIDHHLTVKERDCPAVASFKTNVVDDLKRRYSLMDQDVLCNSLAILCTFLDPRYKSMPFLTHQRRTMVHDRVLTLLTTNEEHAKDSQTETDEQMDGTDGDSGGHSNNVFACKRGKLSQDDVSFLLGGYFETKDCEIVVPSTAAEELDLYISEKPVTTKINPFDWWKVNCSNYPNLSKLARRVLCSPATSVPSERVFSTAGGTVSKSRAALDSESVDKLIFLNKRLKSTSAEEKTQSVAVKTEPADVKTGPADVSVKREPVDQAVPLLPRLPSLPDIL